MNASPLGDVPAPGLPAGVPGDVEPLGWDEEADDAPRDMVVLTDAAGRTVWVNEAFTRHTGYALSDLVGRTPGSVLQGPGTDPRVVRLMSRHLAAGLRCPTLEVLNYRKDGSELWLRMDIEPVPGPDGRPVQFIAVQADVGAWRVQRAAADARRLKLRLAGDSQVVGFWERDLSTGAFRLDEQVLAMWGFAPQAPAPTMAQFLDRIPEPDRTLFMSASAAARRTREPTSVRIRVVHGNGPERTLQLIWRVMQGQDGGLQAAGMTIDVTESALSREQRLRLSEQFEVGVGLTRMAVWVNDLTSGRVTLNQNGYALLELDPAVAPDRDVVLQRVHPQDLPLAASVREQALARPGPVRETVRLALPSGTERHLMLHCVAIRNATGQPVRLVGAAVDISEQMQRAQEADTLARRLQVMVDVTQLGSWQYDAHTGLLTMDDRDLAIHGLPGDRHALSPREWLACVHPEDAPAQRALFSRGAAGVPGTLHATQYRILRPDGAVRHVRVSYQLLTDGSGRVTGAFGTDLDVTEQVQAMEEARRASDLWAVAAGAIGLAVWEHQPDTDHWTCDDAMYRLFGREPGSVDAATLRGLGICNDDMEQLRALKTGTPPGSVYSHEFTIRLPDGQGRRLATRGTSLRDAGGKLRYMGVCWDITAEHEARAALSARDQLQRANEAKSEFISRLSHELRTPLNAILGFSQLLEMGMAGPLDERALRHAGQIRQAGQHMLRLVGEVVQLAQLEAGVLPVEMEPTSVARVFAEAADMLQPLADDHQVAVRVDATLHDLPVVRADAQRLRQVALNLLSNAIKYNRPGGLADVRAAARDGVVVVEVRDTGIGMDHAQLRDLFTPYARLGREHSGVEGIGLGMGLTKAMVERMGGRIEVESHLSVGSAFRITLLEHSHHGA